MKLGKALLWEWTSSGLPCTPCSHSEGRGRLPTTSSFGFSDSGQLAPDSVINTMVRQRLERPDAKQGFILDGYPRNVAQAGWLEAEGVGLDRVMNIELPEWAAVRKIMGRRHCRGCGQSFNVADIQEGGLDMPAILPDFDACERGGQCPRELGGRVDDTEEIVRRRFGWWG
ncbi:unnamed protein product [Discosporangium mesarthrocarpum]